MVINQEEGGYKTGGAGSPVLSLQKGRGRIFLNMLKERTKMLESFNVIA